MSCENPLRILNPRYKKMTFPEYTSYCLAYFGDTEALDKYIEVPCGCCHSCERSRMRSYMIRLLYELSVYPDSLFITLTFDDYHLDKFRDNPNKAVRLFLDRVRKTYGKTIRHWIVPEFGSLRGRLHYHGLLFGVGDINIGYRLDSLWRYGFIYVGYANDKTARYITKYVTKSLSRPYGKDLPRIISSKGVGASYLTDENIEFHCSQTGVLRPYILFGSYKVPLPRYYYDKIFSDEDKLCMLIERSYNPPDKVYVAGVPYSPDDAIKARRRLFLNNISLGLSFKPIRRIDNINKIIYESKAF